MKKIFYLLFIGILAFGSCTKQDPIEVNITDSSLIDTSIIGHWKATSLSSDSWINGQIDLHFFPDGYWDIWGYNGISTFYGHQGSYRTHSGNVINIIHNNADGNRNYNYSINNGQLTITPISGQDGFWVMKSNITGISAVTGSYYQRITNLYKQ